jgi:phosphohistidine phosphatase
MLELILMRHAKSDLPGKTLGDFERTLSKRGKTDAPRMGRELARRGLIPEKVLCSPARRTRESLELVLDEMEANPSVVYDETLYTFGDGLAYFERLRSENHGAPLMLMGHNPSVQNLALSLCTSGDPALLAAIGRKFPTAAVAIIMLPGDNWSELALQAEIPGELKLLLTPKTLGDQ